MFLYWLHAVIVILQICSLIKMKYMININFTCFVLPFFVLFLFFFLGPMPQPEQQWIWATSVNYVGFITCWATVGILSPYWEIGPLQIHYVKMRSYWIMGESSYPHDLNFIYKHKSGHRHAQREDNIKRHKNMAIYKDMRTETCNRSFSPSLRRNWP